MKRFSLCLWFLVACLLVGCASQPAVTPAATEGAGSDAGASLAMPTGEWQKGDDAYTYDRPVATLASMAETEDGLYFFSGMSGCFLYFMDRESGQVSILCNRPDCLHTEEPDIEKIAGCNALLDEGAQRNFFYVDPYLYSLTTSMDPVTLADQINLTQISKDGLQRTVLYTFPREPVSVMIHRGYLYWSVMAEDQYKDEPESPTTAWLYRLPLSNLKGEPELFYEYEGYYAYISELKGYRDWIYFGLSGYGGADFSGAQNRVMRIPVTGGAAETVVEPAGTYAFCGDQLVYYFDHRIYAAALNGQDVHPLDIPAETPLYSDDQYLVVDNDIEAATDESPAQRLTFYDGTGKQLAQVDLPEAGPSLAYGSNAQSIYISSFIGENEHGHCFALWRISKEKIADGSAELEEIFRYEPTLPDRGIARGLR